MPLLYSILYVIVLGIASHFIGEAIPRAWFHYDKFPYRTYGWEHGGKFYDKIGIKHWKDRLPDMSRIMKDMVPKRLGRTPKSEEVWTLVQETCRAEIVHLALCLCAPVVWLFWWNWIGVLCAALIVIGNFPFVLIQRYNRPILASLAKRLEAREERKRKHEGTDSIS